MHINLLGKIKNRFLAGLTVVIPGVITVFVILWLLKEVNLLFSPFSLFLKRYIHIYIPDIGLILLFVLILFAGFLITNWIGRGIVNLYENVMLKIPLVNLLYKSTKQWVDIFSPDKTSFKKFILVKYKDNKYIYGFLTSNTRIKEGSDESDYVVVYVPTNHLYIGVNIIASKNDIIETNLSVEQGINIVLSAGIAFPDKL
ncbi:MAG: DUF502 domain-containing protein [Deltaproteobacteria bacterium]|jgi:uncharacterized membrane protein|nr:DUF502 domain-containing protein [Deltaproteobacteria bacterium]MCL5879354.1 DUF502 domain-containing protein [Deltaproteobacteria bacterium]MDA8304561.1 DUF502 domain-containing protein [Deltaproteobacteria bacterium]